MRLGSDEVLVKYDGGASLINKRWLVAGTNTSGPTLFKNVYDEFGRPGSANQGRFQCTGQIWHGEIGLFHFKARAYAPSLGRILR